MDVKAAEEFMQVAISEAKKSQTPYGAAIVKNGEIVAQAGNMVQSSHDPTAHAEINAIRQLTEQLGSSCLEPGYILYTTSEPCPMCAATCVWSGISGIVYGVGADDFEGRNPNIIQLRCQDVVDRSPNSISIQGGVLRQFCKQLHADYPLLKS